MRGGKGVDPCCRTGAKRIMCRSSDGRGN